MNDTQKWRALIRNLRKHFPVEEEVTVRRRRLGGKNTPLGLTTFNGRSYWVRINSNQDWAGQVDALLHEWSHVRCVEAAYQHGPTWSTSYGEIYSLWCKDFVKE